MPPAPPQPELAAAAPALAEGVCRILAHLYAIIARVFLKHPTHVVLIVPLCRYLNRTRDRFTRLMAHYAAGTLRTRNPRPGRPSGARPTKLPRTRAWLIATLRHEAAVYASQLEHLLNAPESALLVAACPQAQRLLRPVCNLLGIRPTAIPPLRRHPRRAVAPPPVPMVSSGEPARPRIGRAASPPDDASAFTPRPLDLASLCPRLVDRWPFVHLRRADPA